MHKDNIIRLQMQSDFSWGKLGGQEGLEETVW